MKLIFFPLENYSRELDSRLLVIDEIAKMQSRSHERIVSIILPKNLLPLLLKFIRSRVSVLHKTLQKKFRPFIEKIVDMKGNYYFLEEEYFDRFSNNSIRFGSEDLAVKAFASTKVDYDSLSERLGASVYLTGNPRIDVLHDGNNIFKKEINSLKSKYGSFALFNSNFSFRNSPSDHSIASLDNEGIFASDSEKTALLDFLDRHSERFDHVYSFLLELANARIYDSVIYRPHPNESVERVISIFEGTKVIVDSSDNVVPWLMSASVIYHCGCTTAIESSIVENKAIFLFPFSGDHASLSFLLSKSYIDLDGSVNLINSQPEAINLDLPAGQNKSNPRFASTRIANIIVKDLNSSSLSKLLLFMSFSIIFNLPNIVNLYKSEKESVRRNALISSSTKRIGIRSCFILDSFGIGVFTS